MFSPLQSTSVCSIKTFLNTSTSFNIEHHLSRRHYNKKKETFLSLMLGTNHPEDTNRFEHGTVQITFGELTMPPNRVCTTQPGFYLSSKNDLTSLAKKKQKQQKKKPVSDWKRERGGRCQRKTTPPKKKKRIKRQRGVRHDRRRRGESDQSED